MKILLTAISLFSLNAFAQGGGDRVGSGIPIPPYISIEYPANRMDRHLTETKLTVFADGSVIKEISKKNSAGESTSTYSAVLKLEKVPNVGKCSGQLRNTTFEVERDSRCRGDAGTFYRSLYDEKIFAAKFCGRIQSDESKCARDMITLLEALKVVSNTK